MADLVNTVATRIAIMKLADGAGGPYDGAKVGLIAAPTNLSPDTTLADITQPTYTGYARAAVTVWSAPYNDPATGNVVIDGGDVLFQMTDNVTPTVIYGWFLQQDAVVGPPAVPAWLVCGELFDTPVSLGTPQDGVMVDIVVPYAA